jgi:Mce-associated membrane protein
VKRQLVKDATESVEPVPAVRVGLRVGDVIAGDAGMADDRSLESRGAGDEESRDVVDTDEGVEDSEDAEGEPEAKRVKAGAARRRINWSRVLVYGVLPGVVLLLAVAAGFLKWQDASARGAQAARLESVAAAKDSTIALLSYQPDTVESDLGAAQGRLTGTFQQSYTKLIHDVVIPGAKQKHISAVATVPAVASVSAAADHTVALVFVDQTVIVGTDPPTSSSSSVRVTLDKVAGRWLISDFTPV